MDKSAKKVIKIMPHIPKISVESLDDISKCEET
jgi:hypothetical protein